MRKLRILSGLIATAVGWAACAEDPDVHLVFSTIEDSPDTVVSGVILKEAYHRLGIEISIQSFSGTEALRRANAGEVDGEVCRIDGASKQFTNLVQLTVPVNYVQGAVFSRNPDLHLVGWHSLRPYRIGRVRGVLFAEKGTRGMETVVAEDYDELVALLDKGEVDVVVAPYVNGRFAIVHHPHGDEMKLNGILESYLLYHYLHKKHENLAPAVGKVLKSMVKDGTVTEMRRRAIQEMLEVNGS